MTLIDCYANHGGYLLTIILCQRFYFFLKGISKAIWIEGPCFSFWSFLFLGLLFWTGKVITCHLMRWLLDSSAPPSQRKFLIAFQGSLQLFLASSRGSLQAWLYEINCTFFGDECLLLVVYSWNNHKNGWVSETNLLGFPPKGNPRWLVIQYQKTFYSKTIFPAKSAPE